MTDIESNICHIASAVKSVVVLLAGIAVQFDESGCGAASGEVEQVVQDTECNKVIGRVPDVGVRDDIRALSCELSADLLYLPSRNDRNGAEEYHTCLQLTCP